MQNVPLADKVELKKLTSKGSARMTARLFLLVLFLIGNFTSIGAASAETHMLSVGTRIDVTMASTLDGSSCRDGDPILVKLAEDTSWNGRVIVPANTIVSGKIFVRKLDPSLTSVRALELKFESIEVDHNQIPIEAVLSVRGGKVYIRRGWVFLPITIQTFESPGAALGTAVSYQSPKAERTQAKAELKLRADKEKARSSNFRYGLQRRGQVLLLAKKKPKIELLPGDHFQIELLRDVDVPVQEK